MTTLIMGLGFRFWCLGFGFQGGELSGSSSTTLDGGVEVDLV